MPVINPLFIGSIDNMLPADPAIPERVHGDAEVEQYCDVLGDIYVRVIKLRTKKIGDETIGQLVAQHVHKDNHYSMLMRGRVRCWINEKWHGDFTAPTPIFITAGQRHVFQALLDDTILVCNHDTDGKDEPEILAAGTFQEG